MLELVVLHLGGSLALLFNELGRFPSMQAWVVSSSPGWIKAVLPLQRINPVASRPAASRSSAGPATRCTSPLAPYMTAAALLEVDTCAIEGFDPIAYDRILNLADSPYRSCVVCAAGYRNDSDRYASLAKVRYEPDELIERR